MLFLRLAALSARSALVSLATLGSASSCTAPSVFARGLLLLVLVGSDAVLVDFFSLTVDLAPEDILLPGFVLLLLLPCELVAFAPFTVPLPVRLCKLGSAPSALSAFRSSIAAAMVGIAE